MIDHSNRRLSPRDRAIIAHVARYRLTTTDVLHKLFFAGRTVNAVAKVASRLCENDLLQRHPLVHPRSYLALGSQAAHTLGLQQLPRPLGPQSLPTDYAVLAYANLATVSRQRLTDAELAEEFPWLPGSCRIAPHCREEHRERRVLELLRIDLGGKPDHVARKCSTDISTRNTFREFRSLLSQQCFRLVIVTGTQEKASAIRTSLESQVWPDGLQLHLAVVSDLLLLTTRKDTPHGT